MKVRSRVLAGVGASIGLLCLVLGLLVQRTVVENFNTIENQIFQRNIERVGNAVSNQIEVLRRKAIDWGQWDDTYDFIATAAQKYKDENLNSLTIKALGFRDVIHVDSSDKIASAVRLNPTTNEVETTPIDLSAVLKELTIGKKDGAGLAQIGGELVLFAYTQILPSKRDQESRGVLIVTSLVTGELFEQWSHQTKLELKFWRYSIDSFDSDAISARSYLTDKEPYYQITGSEGFSYVYGNIKDLKDSPVLLFSFKHDRQISKLAEKARNGALLGLIASGCVTLLLLYWIIEKQILMRLATLSTTVTRIAVTGQTHLRLSDPLSQTRSIQWRVSAAVTVCFFAMILCVGFIFETVLKDTLFEIEKTGLRDNVIRAERALQARAEELLGKTQDWAQWDATYDFVDNLNSEYIETNLNYETLVALKIKAVAYFSLNGELLFGREVDSSSGEARPLSHQLQKMVEFTVPLRGEDSSRTPIAGLLESDKGLMVVTRSPILDSERSKKSKGSFIFLMSADDSLANELSEQTKLNLSIYPMRQVGPNPPHLEILSEDEILGRDIVDDISDRKVGIIEVRGKRDVNIQGRSARNTLLSALLLSGVIAPVLAVFAIRFVILAYLRRAISTIANISLTGDTSKRLDISTKDEMGALAQQINSMLETIERTQHELQHARDAAEAANQAKSTFIAKVSHELRTPIHGVVGMLRILMKEETSKSKKAYIAMAKNSAFGLLDTINEILDFSKMETGNLHLEAIEFDVKEVVREALRTVAPRAEEKGAIELLVEVDAGIHATCIGDPLRLKQCLINLLGNSIKFTKSGFVKLVVSSPLRSNGQQTIEFVVEDTGVGIPEDRLPKIFEPFTQADDSVARVFTGTGLGLTIVKQLVEQMNGGVTVTSEVGKGSRFVISVSLPTVGDIKERDTLSSFPHRRVAILHSGSAAEGVYQSAFERLGVETALIPVSDPFSVTALEQNRERFDLIVVSSECLKFDQVMDLTVRVGASRQPNLVAVLSPSEISLRERLFTLKLPYILVRPVSVDDMCLVLAGQLAVDIDAWDNEGEAMEVADRRLRILIADDAETNRVILTSMLHEAGHEVVCVENGLDLIAAVSDQAAGRSSDSPRFDIVLTDVQMPLMDGIAATREVRRIERDTNSGSHVPIVAVTAHAMADEKDRMRQSGVDDIVTKPILPSELSRVLQHLTGVGVVEGGVKPSPESAVSPGRVVANSEPVPQATSCENTPTGSSELDSLCQLVGEVVQEVASVESFGAEAQTVGATPFDVADVFMRSGDSARRSKLIFKAFARSFSEPLQALSTGGEEKEVGKVKEAAHALKGLLLDIGAKDVGGLAADIEDACKRGEGECAFQKVPQLSREVSFVGAVTERLMQRFEQVVSSVKTPEAATGKVTEVVERSENIVNAVLDRDRLAATPVRLLSCAEAAMKDVLGQLSDSDLYDLIPPSLVNPEGVHPSVDLVYQLLDVHDVLQREGNSTNRSLIVFGAFLHGYEELLRELETSSSEKDITRIRETAHSLKTVLRETGCPLGADVAGQIESLCAAGEVDDALGMCESLKRQTRLVGKVVRRIVDESAPS